MEHSDLLSHSVCICKDSFNISLLFLSFPTTDSWQVRQTLINRNSHFSLSLKDYEAAKQLPCPWSGWVWQQWPRPEPDVWRGWADRTQSSPMLPGTSALQSQGMPPQRHWTHSCTTTSSPCKQHIVLGKGKKSLRFFFLAWCLGNISKRNPDFKKFTKPPSVICFCFYLFLAWHIQNSQTFKTIFQKFKDHHITTHDSTFHIMYVCPSLHCSQITAVSLL